MQTQSPVDKNTICDATSYNKRNGKGERKAKEKGIILEFLEMQRVLMLANERGRSHHKAA